MVRFAKSIAVVVLLGLIVSKGTVAGEFAVSDRGDLVQIDGDTWELLVPGEGTINEAITDHSHSLWEHSSVREMLAGRSPGELGTEESDQLLNGLTRKEIAQYYEEIEEVAKAVSRLEPSFRYPERETKEKEIKDESSWVAITENEDIIRLQEDGTWVEAVFDEMAINRAINIRDHAVWSHPGVVERLRERSLDDLDFSEARSILRGVMDTQNETLSPSLLEIKRHVQNISARLDPKSVALESGWREVDTPVSVTINDVIYAQNKFVTVGNAGVILTSTDGKNWMAKDSQSLKNIRSVIYARNTFIAAGQEGMIVSRDGINWQKLGGSDFNDIIFAGGRFVAVGAKQRIGYSTDLREWSGEHCWLTHTSRWRAITAARGKFVIVGCNGRVLISPEDYDWRGRGSYRNLGDSNWITHRAAETDKNLHCITYGNNIFVAVGNDGVIFVSRNGAHWRPVNSQTTENLYGVQSIGETFIVVGDKGTLITSKDGTKWTKHDTESSASLRGITYGNGKFVAVGNNGTILVYKD